MNGGTREDSAFRVTVNILHLEELNFMFDPKLQVFKLAWSSELEVFSCFNCKILICSLKKV